MNMATKAGSKECIPERMFEKQIIPSTILLFELATTSPQKTFRWTPQTGVAADFPSVEIHQAYLSSEGEAILWRAGRIMFEVFHLARRLDRMKMMLGLFGYHSQHET